jgi:hypothetical protein
MGHFARTRSLVWIVMGLATAFIVLVWLFFAFFFYRNPSVAPNTLEFEVAKMCLQVAGVILFGAFVALSTFLFQQEWTQKREEMRRESDTLHDERERQDAVLRSMLTSTLEAYNGVKRIRRILKAETGPVGKYGISQGSYKRHLLDLNDLQLTFEYMKRTVPTIDDARLTRNPGMAREQGPPYDLKAEYTDIESYLNGIFKEFEQKLKVVEEKDTVPLASLEHLNLFVTNTDNFTDGVSDRIDRILETLQKALLVPLILPMVGEKVQSAAPPPKSRN